MEDIRYTKHLIDYRPIGRRPGRQIKETNSAEVKECVELHLHSPIHRHGVVLSQAQGHLYLYPTLLDG
jgi:hypothetical protein